MHSHPSSTTQHPVTNTNDFSQDLIPAMTGRRLVDLIALVNVSSSIARGHFLIRSQQLKVYATSSTVLKGFRPRPSITSSRTPRPDNASAVALKEGVEQDHLCTPGASTTIDPEPRSDLRVTQKKADQYHLPGGAIPPSDNPQVDKPSSRSSAASESTHSRPPPDEAKRLQHASESSIPGMTAGPPSEDAILGPGSDVFYLRQARVSSVLSNLPRKKIPRRTEGDQALTSDGGINSDVFYETPGQIRDARKLPEKVAASGKEGGELGGELSHSRQVKTQSTRQSRELKLKTTAPKDTAGLNEGKDQATFYVHDKIPSGSNVDTTDQKTAVLASELSKAAGEHTKTIVEQASSSEMCALSLLPRHLPCY